MVVAKRQKREKPTKIEQRKVWVWEWGPQVEQTTLLASSIYIGQAQGEEKTYEKRSQRPGGLSLSLYLSHALVHSPILFSSRFWVDMPSRLQDGFPHYFLNKIEL